MSVSSVRQALRSQLRESVSVAILEAAEDLIAAKGLSGAPLLQIAKRAGVAVGTLYNYFEDRDALVRALFEMRRATLLPQIQAAVAAAKVADAPFEDRLRSFVRGVLAVLEGHRKYLKVATQAELLKTQPSTVAQDLSAAIGELIKAGVKERVLAAKHADLLPTVISGAIRALVMRRLTENRPLDDADADALVSLLLDGARR